MKINWNKDSQEDARYEVSDGVMTHYVSEEQIMALDEEIASMFSVAEAFSKGYDHGGADDTYAVCSILDIEDGEKHDFAFDGHGNFEWDTDRHV